LSSELTGIGVSLISVPRFARALERFEGRLLERIFLPEEIAYAGRKRNGVQHLAARFAAKCAARSLLRSRGARGVSLRDLEVAREASGEPKLVLHRTPPQAGSAAPQGFSLSLSHDAEFALASLWAEREP